MSFFKGPLQHKAQLANPASPTVSHTQSVARDLGFDEDAMVQSDDSASDSGEDDVDAGQRAKAQGKTVPLGDFQDLEKRLAEETDIKEKAFAALQVAKEKAKSYMQQVEKVKEMASTTKAIIEKKFQAELITASSTIEELRTGLEDLRRERQILLAQIPRPADDTDGADSTADSATPQRTIPSEREDELLAELDQLTKERNTLKSLLEKTQAKLTAANDERDNLAVEARNASAAVVADASAAKREAELSAKLAMAAKLGGDSKTREVELLSQIDAVKQERDALKEQLADTKQQLAQLESRLKTLQESSQQSADEQQSALLKREADLSAQLDSITKDRNTLSGTPATTQQQLSSVTAERDSVSAELKQVQERLKSEQDLSQKTAADKDSALRKREADLTEQLDSVTKDRNALSATLAATKQAVETAESLNKQLKQQLDETQSQMKSAQESSQQAAAERDNAARKTQSDLSSQVEALNKEVARLSAQLETVTKDRNTVSAQLASVKQELTTSTQSLQQELAEIKQKQQADEVRVKKAAQEFEAASRKREAELTAQLQAVSSKTEGLRAQVASLEAEYNAASAALVSAKQESQIAVEQYKKEAAARKKLHNQMIELKGNIRVYCRARPLTRDERERGEQFVAQFGEDDTEIALMELTTGKKKAFEFDRVYLPDSAQETVFEDVEPLVTSVLDGYNVCIFAYGQTGSGKTFTMEGPPENPGVNLRALGRLFELVAERQADYTYSVTVSVLEIYNETIRDLLVDPDQDKGKKHDIHEGQAGVYVDDLTEVAVQDLPTVQSLLRVGHDNRHVAETLMNADSSRSHLVLTIKVSGQNLTTKNGISGKLSLIDLAGSERVGKSGATGAQLKEASAINSSLSALGNVIAALLSKQSHVPYRDSKLTRLLQDSLGGNSKTLMFVQVSPANSNHSESVCSLQFAQRVRKVELGAAKRNTEGSEVASLRAQVRELQQQLGGAPAPAPAPASRKR
eukprot:TRINITY_DN12952_c0_g1_i1.p1 TRINITY_DN12952_c0_g1~~TRINITY_DN12952_c0_g1_i1.p1  ORF type:complete len:982 (+),score=261.46 TRINITY_DN12952_c0_g1_i1:83-3028(+)